MLERLRKSYGKRKTPIDLLMHPLKIPIYPLKHLTACSALSYPLILLAFHLSVSMVFIENIGGYREAYSIIDKIHMYIRAQAVFIHARDRRAIRNGRRQPCRRPGNE